jgi:hypothetical protein
MSLSDYGSKVFILDNKLWDKDIEDIDVSTETKLKIEKIKTESEDEKKQKLREYIKTFNIDMKHVFRDSKFNEIVGDIEEGAEQISEGIKYMESGERRVEKHGISIYDDHDLLIRLVKEIYREESDSMI